ncbi:cupin domain-containing protein [Bradyrhizobium sp. KBS0727]|uniref:cupin domain-containing protein n=1 Tax=unclassified Bradyrhizobium TaxID=2631580 RepID=UPI00110EB340|nr:MULTISPECIES: cupin domain-containing protein [unclassified Bradyrhizobium]QDW37137.1 cupin domain-containing protein [Bradyrhizobium sp. KBS0725]QDW43737.1 cupin domain-containing protein [Bradyrhizobium sp. KBS0727]
MLTRRGFAGVAACAICGVAGFAASEAFAQGSAATTANGVTRKILSRTDGPASGYETIIMDVTLDPGATVGRHTHPGIESTYIMEGEIELPIQGRPTQMLKAGDAFQVPPETPHAGGKPTTAKTRLLVNYIVEKGKPLATPA